VKNSIKVDFIEMTVYYTEATEKALSFFLGELCEKPSVQLCEKFHKSWLHWDDGLLHRDHGEGTELFLFVLLCEKFYKIKRFEWFRVQNVIR